MIKLSKSTITEAEKNAVRGVLDREYLGMGQEVLEFEERLTDFFGRTAICVANGTAALHLACQAVGIKSGDEVLVPSLTYVASFQAISATGAKPISCDITAKTLTLDWKDAEKRITNRTKAIMPVHYAGGVGDIGGIYKFAKQYGLRVIEDAAHAFGSYHNGILVGSNSDLACFSFDGIKNITSGEGGCIVTEDNLIIKKIRDARLLGVENDTIKRYSGKRSWDFDVSIQGWRYHMNNITAAIGIEQLKRFSKLKNKRQLLARRYDLLLSKNEAIISIEHDYSSVVPHIYVVRIKDLVNREKFREAMFKEGIQTGFHWKPNHLLTMYRVDGRLPLPITEKIYPTLITLPLHADLNENDIDFICKKLISLIELK
jgi:dTDP-4-amino-4,6-dideoxygalactose transaminase